MTCDCVKFCFFLLQIRHCQVSPFTLVSYDILPRRSSFCMYMRVRSFFLASLIFDFSFCASVGGFAFVISVQIWDVFVCGLFGHILSRMCILRFAKFEKVDGR